MIIIIAFCQIWSETRTDQTACKRIFRIRTVCCAFECKARQPWARALKRDAAPRATSPRVRVRASATQQVSLLSSFLFALLMLQWCSIYLSLLLPKSHWSIHAENSTTWNQFPYTNTLPLPEKMILTLFRAESIWIIRSLICQAFPFAADFKFQVSSQEVSPSMRRTRHQRHDLGGSRTPQATTEQLQQLVQLVFVFFPRCFSRVFHSVLAWCCFACACAGQYLNLELVSQAGWLHFLGSSVLWMSSHNSHEARSTTHSFTRTCNQIRSVQVHTILQFLCFG